MAALTATPTRLLLQPMRTAMGGAQNRLTDAQTEVTTGRHANPLLALGSAAGSDIGIRLQLSGTEQDLETAKQAQAKAGVIQSSLLQLTDLSSAFRATLTAARSTPSNRNVATNAAASALSSMRETLNTTFDGQYLFGGVNSGTAPVKDYESGARTTIISAFTAEFGFPPDDPAVSTLTPAQIQTFLDGSFSGLFEDSAWSADWSSASDETATVRIGGEEIDAAASSNAQFARKMAAAFSMIDVLGRGQLGRATLETVIDTSLALVSQAQAGIGDEQARIGAGESRLARNTASLEARRIHFTSSIQTLEGVDSYEAATRVNVLMSELEASYALTARISKMSLLSYI